MTADFLGKAIARAESEEMFVGHALMYWRNQKKLARSEAARVLGTNITGYAKVALCLMPPQDSPAFAASVDKIARHAGCESETLLSILRDYGVARIFSEKYGGSSGMLLAARDDKDKDRKL